MEDLISRFAGPVFDKVQGLRCASCGYQYIETASSLASIYSCGVNCVEDMIAPTSERIHLLHTVRIGFWVGRTFACRNSAKWERVVLTLVLFFLKFRKFLTCQFYLIDFNGMTEFLPLFVTSNNSFNSLCTPFGQWSLHPLQSPRYRGTETLPRVSLWNLSALCLEP